MKGLVIKQPWIDYILNGEKSWEIRGSNTHIRGEVYLIQSGSGKIMGKATLTDAIRLSDEDYFSSVDKHKVDHGYKLPYKNTHAWVFEKPVRFSEPIPYQHPQGAVIWVNLQSTEKNE